VSDVVPSVQSVPSAIMQPLTVATKSFAAALAGQKVIDDRPLKEML